MLKVALPKGGTYSEPVREVVRQAGYRQRQDTRDLAVYDSAGGIEFVYLEPSDIPTYVASGHLDLGFTTTVMVREDGSDVQCLLELDIGPQSLRVAVPSGSGWTIGDLEGRKLASRYPRITRQFLVESRVRADVIKLDGGVPVAVQLGLSDAIVDIVDNPSDLRATFGLVAIGEPVLLSSAMVVRRAPRPDREELAERQPEVDGFVRRIRGVTHARRFAMLEYNCPEDKVDEAKRLARGAYSPTFSTMLKTGWVALRVLIARTNMPSVAEALRGLGCDAIVVSSVEYCGLEDPTLTA